MSGVVLIISIPIEEHEICLLKKKKVTIKDGSDVMSPSDLKSNQFAFEKEYGNTQEIQKQSMEKAIREAIHDLEIADVATWKKTQDNKHFQIIIPVEGDKCEEFLAILRENEIGNRLNSKIYVSTLTELHNLNEEHNEEEEEDHLHERTHSGWNLFMSSVRSRLTVAQVVENVKAKAVMTFDFFMWLLISTTLCALGLVENNGIIMLSSMLICPMMGPVMAGTFGSVIRDKYLQKTGVKSELIGLGAATLVGFCYGSIVCIATDKYGNTDWPTYQMYSRGNLRSLWVEAIIALLSGAAVALGVLSDNFAPLIGVAISTSLMPPAVNAGLLWSLGFVYYLKNDEGTRYASLTATNYFSRNSGIELAALGAINICLTLINIICIYVAGILVFWIKEVAPNATTRDHACRRFWKHDIKIARNYNITIQSGNAKNTYQNFLDQVAESERIKDLNHFSTDLSKDNNKVKVRRSEYTWSPCFNDVYSKYKDMAKKNSGRSQYRRLSQIFPRKEENLAVVSEKTPLLQSSNVSEYLLSSGKKITVTPCDL